MRTRPKWATSRIAGCLGVCLLLALGAAACAKAAKAEDYGLFCKEHGVPEKFCTICHKELKDKLLMCAEHGNIPEDICTLCHKENKDKYDIEMCPEHGLPKHFCIKCEEAGKGEKEASGNLINDGWCEAFGEKTSDGKAKHCKLLPIVRLASAELGTELGLATALVGEEEFSSEVTAYAEAAYDGNRHAEIASRVSGVLKEARLDVGAKVAAGAVLAVVDSSEVSSAKADYLAAQETFNLAEANSKRLEKLLEAGAIAAKEGPAARAALNQARAALRGAEQRLHNLRFDEKALAEVLRSNDTQPFVSVVAPITGTIVARDAVMGVPVEPGKVLYTVADNSNLWLWINVHERDIDQVRAGQEVTFVAGSNETYAGRVTWAGAEVDEKTRTAKVRAELANPEGKLRARQVGKARIKLGEPRARLTIPRAAVQRYENVDLVFLPEGNGAYRPQRIKAEPVGDNDKVEVSWGLKANQEVVVAGAFLLKTEIMKGSIGAGCCE